MTRPRSRATPPARGGPRDGPSRPHGNEVPPPLTGAGLLPASLGRPTLAMVANLKYPESHEVVAGARHRSRVADCTILLADANAFVEREHSYERLLAERRVDGLLMATFMPTTSAIAAMARHGLPVVLVGRRIPWLVPGVSVDDEAGMRAAVDHLAGLGHREIAYVAGPGQADTVHRRLEGFRRAMELAGLPLTPDHVATSTADQHDGPARAVHRLLSSTPRPTAIVLWSIGDAGGALLAVRELGLAIPRDLSLVAFNDAPTAVLLSPALTVVRLPLWELAEAGVGRMVRALRGEEELGDVLIPTPPELVVRASTAPPARRV